jgi:RNA polymerase sigma-70 factor, ECF subfamily
MVARDHPATCYSRLKRGTIRQRETEFDDEIHSPEIKTANPEALLERSRDSEALRRATEELPEEFREIVVMRELEGIAYTPDRRGHRRSNRHRDVAAGAYA